jgi:hypothetical protein
VVEQFKVAWTVRLFRRFFVARWSSKRELAPLFLAVVEQRFCRVFAKIGAQTWCFCGDFVVKCVANVAN